MGNSPSWGANEPPWDSFLAKAPPSWRFSAKAAPNLELLCLNSNFCSIDLPGSFLSHSMENMLRVQFPTWLFWGLYLFILNFSALAGSSLEHENYSWAGFFCCLLSGVSSLSDSANSNITPNWDQGTGKKGRKAGKWSCLASQRCPAVTHPLTPKKKIINWVLWILMQIYYKLINDVIN